MTQAADRLSGKWWRILRRIQRSAPVLAALPALRSCAVRYGWPADAYGSPAPPIRSFADFVVWITENTGVGSSSIPPATLRVLQRRWSAIFVTCARPLISLQERLQTAQRAAFLRAHRAAIAALEASYERVIAAGVREYGAAAIR